MPDVGHNPLGGWSVIALLGLLIAAVGFGLFTQDVDGLESGPLTYLVSYETADSARYWHGLVFDILLYVIGVHVFAVLFYLVVKRDNLIGPMITGSKGWKHQTLPVLAHVHWWRIPIGMVLAGGIAYWVSLGCPLPF